MDLTTRTHYHHTTAGGRTANREAIRVDQTASEFPRRRRVVNSLHAFTTHVPIGPVSSQLLKLASKPGLWKLIVLGAGSAIGTQSACLLGSVFRTTWPRTADVPRRGCFAPSRFGASTGASTRSSSRWSGSRGRINGMVDWLGNLHLRQAFLSVHLVAHSAVWRRLIDKTSDRRRPTSWLLFVKEAQQQISSMEHSFRTRPEIPKNAFGRKRHVGLALGRLRPDHGCDLNHDRDSDSGCLIRVFQ